MSKRGPLPGPAILLACASLLVGCARGSKALTEEQAYGRFVGTWVNMKYPGTLHQSQVTVIRPDHVGEDRLFPDSAAAEGEWRIEVKKTWVDGKGYTYCQFFITYIKGTDFAGTALLRVDKKGKILEINSRRVDRNAGAAELLDLERIDPQMNNYWIYYRK